jgi:hypothetical protein
MPDTSPLEKMAAPAASNKTSTELLAGLLAKNEGKPRENLKSKLTDTDVLFRFAAGLAAAASGDATAGAALVGAGLKRAGTEASEDNKNTDASIEDLTLKLADAKQTDEAYYRGLDAATIEQLGPAYDQLANANGVYESTVKAETIKRNEKEAAVWWDAASNMDSGSEERVAAIGNVLRLKNVRDDDDSTLAKSLAQDKPDYDTARVIGLQTKQDVFLKAWAVLEKSKGTPADFETYYSSLMADPKVVPTSAGDVQYKMYQEQVRVLALANRLKREDTAGEYANVQDILTRHPEISDTDRAVYQLNAKDIEDDSLQDFSQVVFDSEMYDKELNAERERMLANNAMYATSNDPADHTKIISDAEVEIKAHRFATAAVVRKMEARYSTRLHATAATVEALTGRDPANIPMVRAYTLVAKEQLIAEGEDPKAQGFDQKVAMRVDALRIVAANTGVGPTSPATIAERKTPAELAVGALNTGVAKTVFGISNLLN